MWIPRIKGIISVLAVVLTSIPALAQHGALIPSHKKSISVASGKHSVPGDQQDHVIAFRQNISVSGVPWLRVHFSNYNLGQDSYLIITSLEDQAQQRLDATSIRQWRSSSAFFNGGAVEVALYVAPSDSEVFFMITELTVGEPISIREATGKSSQNKAILACTDDRDSSNHPAVSRGIYRDANDSLVANATSWIGSNGAHLTAGHTVDPGHDFEMIEFNVPASDSDDTPNFAHPGDQYPVDSTSIQYEDSGIGDDWGVFNVFPNSNTGLLPIEAQNAFIRMSKDPLANGDVVRITGYGNNDGVDNRTQQTRTGSYDYFDSNGSGSALHTANIYVRINDSGSPFIDEATSTNIGSTISLGIVTHKSTSNNCYAWATSFRASDLAAAVDNFPGTNTIYVDANHPSSTEDGSAFKPYDTITEGLTNVAAGGIVSIVEGSFSGTSLTVDKDLTLESTGGIIDLGSVTVTAGNTLTIRGRGINLGGSRIDVASSATLKIEDGVEIIMSGGGDVWSEGVLTVEGTGSRPVTFKKASGATSNWDYIYLYGSGTEGSTINYAELSGSQYGIHTNNAGYFTGDNITATYNYYEGLKLYNTTSQPTITNSNFSLQTKMGVYVYGSSGEFRLDNDFVNNGSSGLQIAYSSTIYGGANNEPADILSEENNIGINVYESSYAKIGDDYNSFGGSNNIYGNTSYDAKVNTDATLIAEHTFWGESPPNTNDFSACSTCTFDYEPYLSDYAIPSSVKPVETDAPVVMAGKTTGIIDTSSSALFVKSIRDLTLDNLKQALEETRARRNHEDLAIRAAAQRLYVQLLLNSGQTGEGVNYGEELLNGGNLELTDQQFIRKLLFYAYLLEQEKDQKAEDMLDKLYQMGDVDAENGLLATVYEDVTGKMPSAGKVQALGQEEELPTTFTLGNYPNPFNPSTNIQYGLPQKTHVMLEVYDLIGRKVAQLVNKSQGAGQYTVRFEADDLPSGLYIYRLQTPEKTLTEKMFLIK